MSCCCCVSSSSLEPADSSSSSSEGVQYGQKRKFDANFKGPIQDRSCTDIICLVLFIVALLGQAVVTGFAVYFGEPKKLIMPRDSQGNYCGLDVKVNEPELFYFDLSRCVSTGMVSAVMGVCPTPSICVPRCPTQGWVWTPLALLEAAQGGLPSLKDRSDWRPYCQYGVDPSTSEINVSVSELVGTQRCAAYYLTSVAVAHRCVPKVLLDTTQFIGKALETAGGLTIKDGSNATVTDTLLGQGSVLLQAQSIVEKLVSDILVSWPFMIVGIILAVLLTIVYLLALRLFACPMVWITMFAFFGSFCASTAYCLWRYVYILRYPANTTTVFQFQVYTSASDWAEYLAYKETWLVLGLISGCLTLLVFCILLFLLNRIRLAVALLEEASKAVGAILTTLAFPLIPAVLKLAWCAYFVAMIVYIVSIGKYTADTVGKNCTIQQVSSTFNLTTLSTTSVDELRNRLACLYFTYTGNYWQIALHIYNVAACLWILNFLLGLCQLVLAGTFASWFWAWDKSTDLPTLPVLASLWRAVRYHLGSVAFGALIIAVVQLIRILLEVIQRRVKGRQNAPARFILCCCKCCFACLEKCLQFLTRNAYIMVAIYGRNFCLSAKDAFFILMRNVLRVAVVDRVTAFILFVGKLLLLGANVCLAYFFYSGQIPYLRLMTPTMNYFFVPVIIQGVATLLIMWLFFSVFDMAVDTLFLCVMEDLERHDGSSQKPYFMSRNCRKILGVKNDEPVQ